MTEFLKDKRKRNAQPEKDRPARDGRQRNDAPHRREEAPRKPFSGGNERRSYNPNFTPDNQLRDGGERKRFSDGPRSDDKPRYGDKPRNSEKPRFGERKWDAEKPRSTERKWDSDKPRCERSYGDKPRFGSKPDGNPRFGDNRTDTGRPPRSEGRDADRGHAGFRSKSPDGRPTRYEGKPLAGGIGPLSMRWCGGMLCDGSSP